MEVAKQLDAIRERGAQLIAVTQSKPSVLQALLEEAPVPFPFVCDPDRANYHRFGLERGTWMMFYKPRVLAHYLSNIFWGIRPKKPAQGEDLLQLGGDFIIDRQHQLIFAHRSKDPADRPRPKDLLRHLVRLSSTESPHISDR